MAGKEKSLLLPCSPEELDPAATFGCGQCFRWRQVTPGCWQGVALGRLLTLEVLPQGLVLTGLTPEEFENQGRRYFDLDRDYGALRERYRQDPILRRAVDFAPGLRLLRQDGWEALCTFIVSQNNRIPRITAIVERLCACFGDPLEKGFFTFPGPERLAALTPGQLEPLRCGYRGEYLLDCARRVADGRLDLEALEVLPLEEAMARLREVKGVGPKVAQCALLFGFGRMECFPEDTWIRQARQFFYPQGLPDWSDCCPGIAQQFLFHYARCGGIQEAKGEKTTLSA